MFRWAGYGLLLAALAFGNAAAGMAQQDQPKGRKARELQAGKEEFRLYCSSCHGEDAKGHGPEVPALREPPPDLTTLAKRNNGKFSAAYVKNVLIHGANAPAHGPADMPVWGRTFTGVYDRELTEYLQSIQVK